MIAAHPPEYAAVRLMAERFTARERINRRTEFTRVFDAGVRTHGRFMTLVVLRTATPGSRLGIVATKKLGGAVQRNRAKRLVRELFRRHKPSNLDIVVLPRRELLETDFASLEADYRAALRRHERRSR